MRKFQPRFGKEVDLDNPKTYSYLKTNTCRELNNMMFKEIGYALVYMNYFRDRRKSFPIKKLAKDKRFGYSGYNQRLRVCKLIQNFADNTIKHYEENRKNALWYKEQIFLFQ